MVLTGMVSLNLLPLHLFALSFIPPSSSISVSPFGTQESLLLFGLLALLLLSGPFLTIIKISKTIKKFINDNTPRHIARCGLASPSTRTRQRFRLVLQLLQISSALPRSQYIYAEHVVTMRHMCWTGMHSMFSSADFSPYRLEFMCSQWIVAVSVMLAFGPVFAPVAEALYPGKEGWSCPPCATRRPLLLEGLIRSKDVASGGLNLWGCLRPFAPITFSVEATAPPQADKTGEQPSWTSGHLSIQSLTHTMTNCHRPVCPFHV